jgi:hypothetical protein
MADIYDLTPWVCMRNSGTTRLESAHEVTGKVLGRAAVIRRLD